jgi:transposase
VIPPIDSLPNDLESLKRLLAMERAARIDAEAKAASAEAAAARAATNVSSAEALIAHLKLAIEKMRRELYGSRSERGRKLLDQMELELEDLETTAA